MTEEVILKNRYRLYAQQGSGGMSVVYRATDLELSRTVAVKILRPSLTSDPVFLKRFRDEARSIANLSHPNIVTLYDVGSEGSTHYIVMEFVEGQDLKKIIKTSGTLAVERALKIAIQMCAGIGFAHRAGLVHADVKPQNILVTRNDVVKVMDFGIAQAFSDNYPPEKTTVVWGSPHYFAPEQARGERPTPASDVYSIGIIMFEMLTGRLPYVGADQQQLALAHIRGTIPMAQDYNPALPDALAHIIYKVMSKDPAARYRTADQLGHVLESYRDRGREAATPYPQYTTSAPPLPFTRNEPQAAPPASTSAEPQTYTPPTEAPPTAEINKAPAQNMPFGLGRLFKPARKKSIRVFISYRRLPSAMLANYLATQLGSQDMNVYVDTRMLDGGGPFPDRLVQAIRHSDIFVCLLADTTLESEWVQREIEHAHQFNIPMIPIFQESYQAQAAQRQSESVKLLLLNDGVHILDIKNVYVDEAVQALVRMIKTTARKGT